MLKFSNLYMYMYVHNMHKDLPTYILIQSHHICVYKHDRLRRNFKEGPKSGLSMVRVQFSDVHQMILEAFPGNTTSSVEVAKLLTATFPSSERKRETKGKKEVFYVGIERGPSGSGSKSNLSSREVTIFPMDVQLSHELVKNQLLTAKIHQLEQELQSVQQATSQSSTALVPTIRDEFSLLLSEGGMLCFGPDSLEHLDSFSLAGIIRNVRETAPNLYSLLCDLGDTKRNARDEVTTTHEEIKALTSLCTLANARSQRAKGVQLFLSIMLIARAVNKQVRTW